MRRLFSPRGVYCAPALPARCNARSYPSFALCRRAGAGRGVACCSWLTRAVPTAQQMQSLLVNNLVFALRCAASPDSFFFGPTRDLLLTSSRRLRVQLNLSRLRKCVQWTGCIACWHKRTSRERLYAPGGLGFAAAQAEFHALA